MTSTRSSMSRMIRHGITPTCHRVSLQTLQVTLTTRSMQAAAASSSSSSILPSYRRHSSNFNRPAPPSLSRAQQREFEELIRRVNAPASQPAHQDETSAATNVEKGNQSKQVSTTSSSSNSEEDLAMHPDLRKKPKPKFEGDVNPETGEVGGPKHEPLVHRDWSYGGRATDF